MLTKFTQLNCSLRAYMIYSIGRSYNWWCEGLSFQKQSRSDCCNTHKFHLRSITLCSPYPFITNKGLRMERFYEMSSCFNGIYKFHWETFKLLHRLLPIINIWNKMWVNTLRTRTRMHDLIMIFRSRLSEILYSVLCWWSI